MNAEEIIDEANKIEELEKLIEYNKGTISSLDARTKDYIIGSMPLDIIRVNIKALRLSIDNLHLRLDLKELSGRL